MRIPSVFRPKPQEVVSAEDFKAMVKLAFDAGVMAEATRQLREATSESLDRLARIETEHFDRLQANPNPWTNATDRAA